MVNLAAQLDRGDVVLRYSATGRGRVVLMLHGAGADGAMFAQQAASIAESGRRAVVLDLRGHGASRPSGRAPTPDLLVADAIAVLDALDAHHGVVVVGHSLGGNIAQALVRSVPGRFAGLAVLDATWSNGPLSVVERALLRLAAPSLALVPERVLPRLMARASAVTAAGRADAERAFAQLRKREFLDVWRAVVAFVAPEPDYRTPVPLLLVRGAEDRTGNIRSAMPAWAVAEGVDEHVVPGAGHIVTQDAPAATTRLLLDFLDGIEAADGAG